MPPLKAPPPPHRPEMLYIGCVDARLDPIDDIGIEKGKSLIYRNIGALVLENKHTNAELNGGLVQGNLDIPENMSMGATLEFFLGRLPLAKEKLKHIVVSGHTDCGGIKACCEGVYNQDEPYLKRYLENLSGVRQRIMAAAAANRWNQEKTLHALEEESVRQSIDNLQTYPSVKIAIAEGRLKIHGWVINTATQRIEEMDLVTRQFQPMGAVAGIKN